VSWLISGRRSPFRALACGTATAFRKRAWPATRPAQRGQGHLDQHIEVRKLLILYILPILFEFISEFGGAS